MIINDMTINDMTINELILNDDLAVYGEPYFRFWTLTVIDAMGLLGTETDGDLQRLCQLLLDHHNGFGVKSEEVERIRQEIVRLRGAAFWGEETPLGLKYRCLNAIASSRVQRLANIHQSWQYGLVTAFQTINFQGDKDEALIDLVQQNAAKYGVDLYVNSEA